MEIPKNTTQIGEVSGNYKVFIEDYVISYIKQLCRQEPDRKKRIALYGVIKSEEPQQYFFIYGGAEVKRHGRGDRHLTQQDYEEFVLAGKKHFEEYMPIGFLVVEDELPEATCLFFKEKEIYVEGYHIFYEKNESMLAFLLQRQNKKEVERKDEFLGEQTQTEDGENLCQKERAYERRREYDFCEKKERRKVQEPAIQEEIKLVGIVKSVAVACMIVFCITIISAMNGMEKMEGAHVFFQKAFQAMTEKKLPDKEEDMPDGNLLTENDKSAGDKLLIEETLARLEMENATEIQMEESTPEANEVQESLSEESTPEADEVQESLSEESVPEANEVQEGVPEENIPEESMVQESMTEVNRTHVVKAGETLLGISMSYYGNEKQVQAICELNGISDSDNIQVGQKIILP